MKEKPKPNNYWTKEKCLEISYNYDTKKEFRETEFSAYQSCVRNKWLDEICLHFNCRKTQGFWDNKENCNKEVLKYTKRSDIQKSNPALYKALLRNKWMDELCDFMIPIGDRFKRCIYIAKFIDNSIYIGLTYNFEQRIKEHLDEKKKKNNSAILFHYKKTNLIPDFLKLTDYINSKDAAILEETIKNDFKNKGWNILNKTKCGNLGGNKIFWTKENCIKESLKYNYKDDFRRKSSGAYNSVIMNNWENECLLHLKYKTIRWNKDSCLEVSKLCKNRKDFYKKYSSAYARSNKEKWLDEFFPIK